MFTPMQNVLISMSFMHPTFMYSYDNLFLILRLLLHPLPVVMWTNRLKTSLVKSGTCQALTTPWLNVMSALSYSAAFPVLMAWCRILNNPGQNKWSTVGRFQYFWIFLSTSWPSKTLKNSARTQSPVVKAVSAHVYFVQNCRYIWTYWSVLLVNVLAPNIESKCSMNLRKDKKNKG